MPSGRPLPGMPAAAAAHRVVNPPPGRELAASACSGPRALGNVGDVH